MEPKVVIIIAFLCALFGGITGGLICSGRLPGKAKFAELEVGKLKVKNISAVDLTAEKVETREINSALILSKGDKEGVACRISKGFIYASNDIVGGQLKGKYVIANNIFAATNPIEKDFNKLYIFAELAALPGKGGTFVLRNSEGPFVPGKGVGQGYMMVMNYDKNNLPQVFSRDLKQKGAAGLTYLLRAKALAKPELAAKKTAKNSKKKGVRKPPVKRRK